MTTLPGELAHTPATFASVDGKACLRMRQRRSPPDDDNSLGSSRMSNATISGRERRNEAMRRLRFALRCMVMLDHACLRTPPRLTGRAFTKRDESYAMLLSAATGCDARTTLPARRRRTSPGIRTRRSNATISGRE
jgi:hypothetical protein